MMVAIRKCKLPHRHRLVDTASQADRQNCRGADIAGEASQLCIVRLKNDANIQLNEYPVFHRFRQRILDMHALESDMYAVSAVGTACRPRLLVGCLSAEE
jgi:hypothetical protein